MEAEGDNKIDIALAALLSGEGGDMLNRPFNTSCTSPENNGVYRLLVFLAEQENISFNSTRGCNSSILDSTGGNRHTRVTAWVMGRQFYAYFTPIVLTIGLLGNFISLCVFLSKNMRHLSASVYLAALSSSDLVALIFYVLIEWLIRGIPILTRDSSRVTFMHVDGTCQMIMYFHYMSRFLSSWLVVAFTVERYIAVCHPLKKRLMCTTNGAKRVVLILIVISFLITAYKPILSVVHDVELWGLMCTTYPEHRQLSFVLDSIYAVFIILVPFIVISILNVLIIRQLFIHHHQQRLVRAVTEESVIRLEFTLILLVVSFCFVTFNLPYFATWCKLFLTSRFVSMQSFSGPDEMDYFRGIAFFTRAIFYMNYCINFFLYSITGAYFRRELIGMFTMRSRGYRYGSCRYRSRCSHNSSTYRTIQFRLSDRREWEESSQRTSTRQTLV